MYFIPFFVPSKMYRHPLTLIFKIFTMCTYSIFDVTKSNLTHHFKISICPIPR